MRSGAVCVLFVSYLTYLLTRCTTHPLAQFSLETVSSVHLCLAVSHPGCDRHTLRFRVRAVRQAAPPVCLYMSLSSSPCCARVKETSKQVHHKAEVHAGKVVGSCWSTNAHTITLLSRAPVSCGWGTLWVRLQ